ncbi:MAG: hypothetical protein WBA15_00895 [Mesorhizobium sp.]
MIKFAEAVEYTPELEQTVAKVALVRIALALQIRPSIAERDFQRPRFIVAGPAITNCDDEAAESLHVLEKVAAAEITFRDVLDVVIDSHAKRQSARPTAEAHLHLDQLRRRDFHVVPWRQR